MKISLMKNRASALSGGTNAFFTCHDVIVSPLVSKRIRMKHLYETVLLLYQGVQRHGLYVATLFTF